MKTENLSVCSIFKENKKGNIGMGSEQETKG
jgi:hypothetical protein